MRLAVLRRVGAVVLALGFLGSMGVSSALAGSIITVNSLADVAANDGACTLREAITAANTNTASGAATGECAAGSGADAIIFTVSGTITLTIPLPHIVTDLSISGAGAITLNGHSRSPVFVIPAGTVALSGLTITAARSLVGAGIDNDGTLTLTNSTISGNAATSGNAAIGGEGGGIFNDGTLTVTNSTISGNSANIGGGIDNAGALTLTNSTISGNAAIGIGGVGGGMFNSRTATVVNSTFSANSSTEFGGGYFNNGRAIATVTNSTISGNSAVDGGGLIAAGTDTLVNSIVAGNTASNGADILDTVETNTTNVIGAPGGKTLADILVPAGLAANGGPTKTVALALVAGNPAIDAGTASACAAAPVNGTDQRGLPRPAACDIGAYEAQPPTIAAHADVKVAVSPPAPTVVTYTKPAGTDEQGGVTAVACLPASGSTFALGSTTVTCTATDAVGHTASGSFQVIVTGFAGPPPPTRTPSPTPTPTPEGSVKAATPVPTGSLPNSAFSPSASTSSGILLAGTLLLVSLVTLAAVNVKTGRRRR